jgi:hypothetical protein
MSQHDGLLLEIEDAEMRHEWVKAEMRRAGNSRELLRFAAEALKELQILRARKLDDQETGATPGMIPSESLTTQMAR